MPLTAKGETILEKLEAEYGSEKGKSVLYAGKNAGTFSGIDAASRADAVRSLCDAVAAMCDRMDARIARRDAEDVKRFHRYGGTQSEDPSKENYYNASEVQQAIEASNRAGRSIGRGEAKLIHSLMAGWRGRADAVASPDYAQLMVKRDLAVKAYGNAHRAWKEGGMTAAQFLAARNTFDQETIDFDRAYAKQAGWLPSGWLTRGDADPGEGRDDARKNYTMPPLKMPDPNRESEGWKKGDQGWLRQEQPLPSGKSIRLRVHVKWVEDDGRLTVGISTPGMYQGGSRVISPSEIER